MGRRMNDDDKIAWKAYQEGRADERARIAVWLRSRAAGLELIRSMRATDGAAALRAAADLIEAMKSPDVA